MAELKSSFSTSKTVVANRSMLPLATRRILLGVNNRRCFFALTSHAQQPSHNAPGGLLASNYILSSSYPNLQLKRYSQKTSRNQNGRSYEKEQLEFDSASDANENTIPNSSSEHIRADSFRSENDGRSNSFSSNQAEFDSPQNPARNTTPSSQSSQNPKSKSSPLPDLRQGIPSTFDAEIKHSSASAQAKHGSDSGLDVVDQGDVKSQSGGRGTGGELPNSAYESSQDRRRNRIMNYMYAYFGLMGLASALYLGREWDNDEESKGHLDIPSGWAPLSIYSRAKARLSNKIDVFKEPTFPKLLPSLDPAPPFTLILSLEDLLVHSEWTRDHGWRMAKRPGVDYFLRYLSQYYELVIFTTLPFAAADPVIRKLDPYRIVMWPLGREATRYENGEYIKDLSYLNRDLSKVIMIDTKSSHAKLQPENTILLDPWKGNPKDRELVSLLPFLEHVASMEIEDTRKAIGSFRGKHIPTEFAAREAIVRDKFLKEQEKERNKRPRSSGVGLLASSLGIKPVTGMGEPTIAQGFEKGKMLSDQIRERGQKTYEALEKEIRENGEKWLKEMEAEEKKLQEESVKSMKSGFASWFGKSN